MSALEARRSVNGTRARWVVVGALVLLLVGIPHHRAILWLDDAPVVKYWKEIVFAMGGLAYASVVLRRRGFTRAELRALLWAAPFVGAVLVRMLIGVFRQEEPYLPFVGGASHVYYVPVFLLAIYLLESAPRPPVRQVERSLRLVLVVTSMAAVLSVLDNVLHLSGVFDPLPGDRSRFMMEYDPEIWRSMATYQSPMVLGMICGAGFLVSLHLLVKRLGDGSGSGMRLVGPVALLGLHFAGLYLTFSRGPLVSTACGTVVVALFGARGLNRRAIADLIVKHWKKTAAAIGGAVGVLVVAVLLLPTALQRHLASIFDWSGDQHNVTRLRRMSIGLERIQEAPWIGHGVGSAQGRLSTYRFRELGHDFFFSSPENQALTWAMEGGVMLLLPGLLVVGFMLYAAFSMASDPERPGVRRLGVLFLGFLAALSAESLIMAVLNGRSLQLGFWALYGVLVFFQAEPSERYPDVETLDTEAGVSPRHAIR